MKIKILHLYPDLLNLYGDRGNIECMRKRLMWRGIDAEVVSFSGIRSVQNRVSRKVCGYQCFRWGRYCKSGLVPVFRNNSRSSDG